MVSIEISKDVFEQLNSLKEWFEEMFKSWENSTLKEDFWEVNNDLIISFLLSNFIENSDLWEDDDKEVSN